MGWLQTHLETFVKPVLGYIPELSKDHSRIFTPQETAVIKNMWRAVKQEAKRLNKPILLAGRDVWIFEVLARREGTATVFRPDISRLTADYVKEDYSQHYLFDTGFIGSIPIALRCSSFTMGSSVRIGHMLGGTVPLRSMGHKLLYEDPKQVFPRMKGARSLILKIERTPKYWRRGYVQDEFIADNQVVNPKTRCIKQELATPAEFSSAALLTIEIYKDSSPAFTDSPVQVTGIYSGVIGYD